MNPGWQLDWNGGARGLEGTGVCCSQVARARGSLVRAVLAALEKSLLEKPERDREASALVVPFLPRELVGEAVSQKT